jgi:hypothetical protein
MNRPAMPTATAARASTGTNSRCPPETRALPARQLHRVGGVEHHRAAVSRMIARLRMSETRLL